MSVSLAGTKFRMFDGNLVRFKPKVLLELKSTFDIGLFFKVLMVSISEPRKASPEVGSVAIPSALGSFPPGAFGIPGW